MKDQLVLSLFPGAGLLDLAFEAEGFCIVKGPDVIWGGDIRNFHPLAEKFDGVIGGPPCQTFSSLAHLVRANGHEPKFGNLIPEFERCVVEASPFWFLMENVPQAPEPSIPGYGVKSFLLDNSRLAGDGGFGLEQRRVRRFSFGLHAVSQPPSLMRWIDLAVFVLQDVAPAVTSTDGGARPSGKRRVAPVTAMHDHPDNVTSWSKRRRVNAVLGASSSNEGCLGATKATKARRMKAVSSSNGGNGAQRSNPGASNGGRGRYKLAEAIRLQGLPDEFLKDSPFTAEGKLKAVANGVPIPMGRAIAKAIKEAIASTGEQE